MDREIVKIEFILTDVYCGYRLSFYSFIYLSFGCAGSSLLGQAFL